MMDKRCTLRTRATVFQRQEDEGGSDQIGDLGYIYIYLENRASCIYIGLARAARQMHINIISSSTDDSCTHISRGGNKKVYMKLV